MTVESTESPPSRSGYAKGRARRQKIVQTATLHFSERGFNGATILDIAAACKISRAGLLHYFADKEALLAAVLEDRDHEDRARFKPYLGIHGGVGILRGIVDLADRNRLAPGLIDLFVRLSTEATAASHPAHDYFRARYERIRTGTAQALRDARDSGYLRPDVDPDDAAMRLTALMDGLQVQWLLDASIDMSRHVRMATLELLTPEGVLAFERADPSAV